LKHTPRYRGQQGTLTQRADGRWVARYRENGRDGKRPQKTFDTRKAGAEWLRQGLDEAQQVQDGDTSILVRRRERGRTVAMAIDDYLAAHEASPGRIKTLGEQLGQARKTFGARQLQSLEPYELQAWRKTISPGYRHDVFAAFKQLLRQAHAWHWVSANPADGIPNPAARRGEIDPITPETRTLLEDEILAEYIGLPTFVAATGLRPEEWLALEKSDVDRAARLVHVRRVFTFHGGLVELGPDGAKTKLQRRTVPLRLPALAALEQRPTRIDTPLLFPGRLRNRTYGSWHMNLTGFRSQVWHPAFDAAGIPRQRIYDLRHAYATESIAAGIDLFTLSRRMGTSLQKIDETYGHLTGDAAERELALLDAYDERRARTAEAGL
jgi:integrase